MALTPRDFDRIKRLGGYATALLADETFREILADLKNDAIRTWADALTPEKREDCWRDLRAIGRLENALKAFGQEYRAEAQKLETAERKATAELRYREAARG
jgi:hypothetical protein